MVVEGEHADHLTTTTALQLILFDNPKNCYRDYWLGKTKASF